MVTLPLEGPPLGGRGIRAGVGGIATSGSAMDIPIGSSGIQGGVGNITAVESAVDTETSADASGLGVGVAFLSLVDIFG